MSSKKSPPAILKKRQTLSKDMAVKIVLESPTQSKNKEEQCLGISCNYFSYFRHLNLDGFNKISVSK